jgi:hypothetical protein
MIISLIIVFIYIDVHKNNFRASARVAPTERFVGATLVVALFEKGCPF